MNDTKLDKVYATMVMEEVRMREADDRAGWVREGLSFSIT